MIKCLWLIVLVVPIILGILAVTSALAWSYFVGYTSAIAAVFLVASYEDWAPDDGCDAPGDNNLDPYDES